MSMAEVQRAVFALLNQDAALGQIITGVYDDAPQADDSGSSDPFPYVTLGVDIASPWDTKTSRGTSISTQIDVWSRGPDFVEAKQITDLVVGLLHRQPLTISNSHHVLTQFETSTFLRDPDGNTRHAALQFRIIFEQT